ncbi:DUF4050 domain-containing protein [Aspergillus affinis]|uniref:DUF4050 domain-containing protein n=1 Tax=Aspergillus affinis TaxID=1070780 RepID=UPI0022FE8A05|nr:uncharacterized protein KD926_001899 [Aspergillus affinis]KAI9044076.1 hypothetical protein KD926_001899 [Aspergillus affinis]
MTTEARDAAIREAKLHVREIVRNDWLFHPSTDSGLPASSSPTPPPHEIAEWRLREYDSSGSELEPVSSPELEPEDANDHDHDLEYKQGLGRATLRSISPRRKRRRQEQEEEMRWNEGLRTWVERRDAWSGALSRTEIRRREQEERQRGQEDGEEGAAQSQSQSHDQVATANEDARTLDSTTSSDSGTNSSSGYEDLAARADASFSIADQDPTTTTMSAVTQQQFPADREREDEPSTADPENPHNPNAATATTINEPSTATPAPATQAATATASSHQIARNNYEDPFIPVAPSLISTSNPIRAAITPIMYPSIYSKVVVQGLTPTVPINLADVTKAMVQGWKADGQWPPKPATQNIVLQDTATVRRPEKTGGSAAGDAAEKQLGSSPESKRRSGIASTVRKVLHFSGFHQHPFHRRGSSSHNQQGQQDSNDGTVERNGIVDQTIPER